MKISEAIKLIKNYCSGIAFETGKPIDENTTRDKTTYGTEHLMMSAQASSPVSGQQLM